MAEGILGKVLGGEPDEGEENEAASGAPLDPAAAAAAMEAARGNAKLADTAGRYFEKQARLVEIQTEHLHEQRAVALSNLRLRGTSERIKIAIQLVFAAAVFAIVLGVAAMVWGAVTSRAIVVEPFDAPPVLAGQGLGGESVARELASRVASIARVANAHSIAQSEDAQADTTPHIKMEIPETGVSPEDLRRLLHLWLGHERRVSGELRPKGPNTVALTLRLEGADPIHLVGSAADADALIQTAAEHAFALLDPVNSVIYLEAQGRFPEAEAQAEALAHHNPGTVSAAEAYSLWADADLDRSRAARTAQISILLNPKLTVGWLEAMLAANDLGRRQAELIYARKLLTTRRDDQPLDQRSGFRTVLDDARARISSAVGDYAPSGTGPTIWTNGANLETNGLAAKLATEAALAFGRHDVALGERLVARAETAGSLNPVDELQLRWRSAAAENDWPRARALAEALVSEQRDHPGPAKMTGSGQDDLALGAVYAPELALALARVGQFQRAEVLIGRTPADCYDCLRVRAQIAAGAGDAGQADHWFAEAVRQGPDLPFALSEWGEALARRGALSEAAEKFRLAHAAGPDWADPLAYWGDVLVRQGRPGEALAKYDEALRHAPAWPGLLRAREAARAAR